METITRRFGRPLLDQDRLRIATDEWARESGRRLQAYRMRLRWSQGALASAVGVTPGTISKAELGVTVPRPAIQFAIAHALMCDVADIWPAPDRATISATARWVA